MMKTKIVESPVVFHVTEIIVTEPFTYTKWEGKTPCRRKVTITLPRGYRLHSVYGRSFRALGVTRIDGRVVPTKATWRKEITKMNEYTGKEISKSIEWVRRPAKLEKRAWPVLANV